MSDNRITVAGREVFRKLVIVPESEDWRMHISVEEGASADVTLLILPGISCTADFTIELNGPKADCRLAGIYLCPENENVHINVEMLHKVPQCTSRQIFKGIVSGKAKADFYGKIVVSPGAQQTEAYQENHSLLLSDTAKSNTRPQLEIYADDVKCSHGATIGKLNEEEQFYMRSRGIPQDEARALQMISFLSPVIDGIPDPEERERIYAEAEAAIRSGFLK